MKKIRNYSNIIMIFMTTILIILLAYIFWITWNEVYRKVVIDPFYEKGSLLLTVVYIIIYFLFAKIYEGFRIGLLKTSEVIYSQSLSLIFANLLTYMQISLIAKKLVNPLMLGVMTAVEVFAVFIWAIISNKLYFTVCPPINMLMIYSNKSAIDLMSKMEGHKNKYNICSMINTEEGFISIKKKIDQYEAVMICDVESSLRNKIVKYCYKKSIEIYMTPKLSDIIIQSSDKLHIFDTPLLICKNHGLSYSQKILKRAMDIIISIIFIIALFPIMIITAIFIKLYDGGPVIFKQKRLTINNNVFEIYKFRSMIVNAEKDGEARLASQNDDRITPIGKIIRKIRLDELPQIFNILIGDMSIVGPRPERPEIAEKYIGIMPEFEFRTKVKAGLTGYAQIMGRYNTTPYDKLKLDLMYIGEYSMFMDIKLMLMTVKILFMAESTEGIVDGEVLPVAITQDDDTSQIF
ncbi:exopolysaccharide biosynthesis polyprenyl glycosylphosphotransferase [Sedimentibacter saalensis]|uniref:Exopolysaccharide biosynthesis polyprenyl glycosylphosphotransferase n=1 Tax=Sedimentibacter saalensis TaxID=130788 RepID=A0A562J833_9FIRM|nr:exopolysaccharide biosynthesis polyprenyl glycosylphosphotransferase [Sedimentibacter saalensis]TWH79352.1 exopolysaccharide biosynthesis polyprenyl glycosylphosphotransferase [Sedimentibacter saalensis]